MAKTAKDYEGLYSDPELRERLKEEIKAGDRGGAPGRWTARKSQLLKREYEGAGGGYLTDEPTDAQRHLHVWTEERWTTRDGRPAERDGEVARYLPEEAWEQLSPEEREATDRLKREGSRRGEERVENTPEAKHARELVDLAEVVDELPVREATKRLRDLTREELETLRTHERRNRDRRTLVRAIERRLAAEGPE